MSHLGNVPADVLVGAVEKLLAKMDDGELAQVYERDVGAMPAEAFSAFVESIFDAFRGRGESSEDAVEGAATTREQIDRRDGDAVTAFVQYARSSPGLLKEATTLFVEQHPDLVTALPATLQTAIALRLTQAT